MATVSLVKTDPSEWNNLTVWEREILMRTDAGSHGSFFHTLHSEKGMRLNLTQHYDAELKQNNLCALHGLLWWLPQYSVC